VLRRAPPQEEDALLASVLRAADYVGVLLEQGAEKAMNGLHQKT
jgi:hypothetical protein